MCGIFAYTGNNRKNAGEVLLDGLTSLEYRGYDSAGIYLPESGIVRSTRRGLVCFAAKCPPDISAKAASRISAGRRTASRRRVNAHPHRDCTGDIWLVHNGIIENYKELRERLTKLGHTFVSSTDTEVLAHLIEEHLKKEKDFEKAVAHRACAK